MVCMYVCLLRMCDYLYIGVYRYTSVCVYMHMGVTCTWVCAHVEV